MLSLCCVNKGATMIPSRTASSVAALCRAACLAGAATLLSFQGTSAESARPHGPLADFDAYIETALDDWMTPGLAVVILVGDETLLMKGYGVLRVGQPEVVDVRTVFPISSVTKVFTATGLALLEEEGRLEWDDCVVDHLPEFVLADPYLTKEVRLSDLLSHRTGLERADLLAYRGDYERPELIRRLRHLQPVSPFRSRFGYHNLMMVVAGEVLARVSGVSWDEFIRQRIFAPLRMTDAHTQPVSRIENLAASHGLVEGVLQIDPLWERAKGEAGFRRLHESVAPAGAIHASITDLGRFLTMLLEEGRFEGRQFLETRTLRDMTAPRSVLPIRTTPEPDFAYPRFFFGCGLGWQLRDYRGRKIVYHPGSSGAVVAYMPEEQIGVAVLANRGCGIPYMVMHEVFDRLLGFSGELTSEEWLQEGMRDPEDSRRARNAELEKGRARDTRPSLPLESYAGSYECDLYGRLEIRLIDERLELQFGPNIAASLRHWERETFRGQLEFPSPGDWLLHFQTDKGEVTAVEIERVFWHEAMPLFVRVAD